MHLVSVDNVGPCGPGCACETGGKLDPEFFQEGDESTVSSGPNHSLTQFTPAGEWAPAGAVLAFQAGVTVGELREALAFMDETDVVTSSETGDGPFAGHAWVEFEPAAVVASAPPARDRGVKTPILGVIGLAVVLFLLSAFRPVLVARTPNDVPSRRRGTAVHALHPNVVDAVLGHAA